MRIRSFGIKPGNLPTGRNNAITDVGSVAIGHYTLQKDHNVHTGVTAILPHSGNIYQQPVMAAVYTINGFGKAAGFEQVRELGRIETPILLTSTLNVGLVADACIAYILQDNSDARSINPLVGECNDGYLNAMQTRPVRAEHVFAAIAGATSGKVVEGCVGAATGTSCYQFKGGIGTASRIAGEYTVGALLQTNFGRREELTIMGVPIGEHIPLDGDNPPRLDDGSVMIVLATDAPLTARQLQRLAKRAAFGLGRTGTVCHHGSGDFVIAFSTAQAISTPPHDEGALMNPLFAAVVETVEESVYNALVAAETVTGRDGNTLYALPHDMLQTLLTRYNRLA